MSEMGWPPLNLDTCEDAARAYLMQVCNPKIDPMVRASRAVATVDMVRRLVARCRSEEGRVAGLRAERDRYHDALNAILEYCEDGEWLHGIDGDDTGSWTTCDGRDAVEAMASDALGEASDANT
jgi:hypothetical protein